MAGLTLNNGTVKVESTTLKLDDVTVSGDDDHRGDDGQAWFRSTVRTR